MKLVKLKADYARKVLKALVHLEYSYNKAKTLSPGPNLDEEALETWESFASRLARAVDLFLTKYLKLSVLEEDPGFDGSLRDFCNFAEKKGWLDNADEWIALREIRNSTVHDYEEDDLTHFHQRIYKETPRVLSIKKWIQVA